MKKNGKFFARPDPSMTPASVSRGPATVQNPHTVVGFDAGLRSGIDYKPFSLISEH